MEILVRTSSFQLKEDPTGETSKKRNEHSNFLYVYFSFTYYLLLSPFRFKKLEPGKYALHRWLPQQILTITVSIMALLQLAHGLHSAIEKIETNDPIPFFRMFMQASTLIAVVVLLKGSWTRSGAYLDLINFVDSNDLLPYRPYKMESIPMIGMICITYTLLVLIQFKTSPIFRPWIAFRSHQNLTSEIDPFCLNLFLSGVYDLSHLFRQLYAYYVILLILFHAWTMWAPTSAFVISLWDHQVGSGPKFATLALKQFASLKRLSSLIERSLGGLILPWLCATSFYYAMSFGDVFLVKDGFERALLFFGYMSFFSILLYSAEIIRKISSLKTWLFEDERWRSLDQSQLVVLLDELAGHSVGISVSGIFTITYSFVGTVIGTLITYFILRLQSASSTPQP